MSINNKIAELLRKKEISQTELAKRTGLSQQNLNRLLNSDDIKISQLIEISKALGVTPTYFFDGSETVNNSELERLKEENTLLKQNANLINQNLNLHSELYFKTQIEVLQQEFSDVSIEIINELINEAKETKDGIKNLTDVLEEYMKPDKEKIKAEYIERIRKIKLTPRAINIASIRDKKKKEDALKITTKISNEELLNKLNEVDKTKKPLK